MTTTTADRYRELAGAFEAKIGAVRPDQWAAPTPCDGWTVRDLVRHVVDTQGLFEGMVGRELGAIPSVDDEPTAAFAAASTVVQGDLDDPARAEETFEGFFGTSTFAQAIDRFACFDLVVHGWDLARATGQEETIEPVEIERVMASTELFGPNLRTSGVCGPEVEVGEDASAQDRLVAFLGRQP